MYIRIFQKHFHHLTQVTWVHIEFKKLQEFSLVIHSLRPALKMGSWYSILKWRFIWFQYNTATITSIFNHWIDRNWIRIKILTLYSYLNKNFLVAFSTCTRKNSNFWLSTTADYGSCIQSIVLLLYDTRAISKSNDDSVLIFCCPSLFRVHRVAKNNTRTLRTLLTSSSSTAAASQNKPWNSLQPCMTDSLLGHFPACVSHSSSTDENFPSSRKNKRVTRLIIYPYSFFSFLTGNPNGSLYWT